MEKSNIGLIGLGIMGQNLALNLADKGWSVSVWNRPKSGASESVADHFVRVRGKGKSIIACEELEDFAQTLQRPRIVMLMVTAEAVTGVIEKIIPYLDEDDIIIDGGNSNFEDTERRVDELYKRGFYFIGAGISGGEEGALHGASIMPGGRRRGMARCEADITEYSRNSRRRYSLLRMGRKWRSRSLCKDGTQWYRICGNAVDSRGVFFNEASREYE